MENRIKHILLGRNMGRCLAATAGRAFVILSMCWLCLIAFAQQATAAESDEHTEAVQVITPEVTPREVSEAEIDDESFEIGAYVGIINIDDFGSEPLFGVMASYHATEDFFLQLNYAISEAGYTSFEELSGEDVRLLTDSEREYSYYNALIGYNIFPGEVFMTSNLTFNSAFYLVGGVGNTRFGGEDNFTITLGTGYRIILRDWLSWTIDFRDHIFKSEIIKEDETTHNLELSTGLTLFF